VNAGVVHVGVARVRARERETCMMQVNDEEETTVVHKEPDRVGPDAYYLFSGGATCLLLLVGFLLLSLAPQKVIQQAPGPATQDCFWIAYLTFITNAPLIHTESATTKPYAC
jgi:hypothetical protein